MKATLSTYLEKCRVGLDMIPAPRKQILQSIADYIIEKRKSNTPAKLTFICTHNSRRSHMAQIWCSAAAAYEGVEGVESYSGGVEVTSFHPNAIAALRRAGIEIEGDEGEVNPRHLVTIDEHHTMKAWSKTYDDPANPAADFAAIMVCSDAEQNCPYVLGASKRISLTYHDPKDFDGTPGQDEAYDERSAQIAREMLYMMKIIERHPNDRAENQ